MERGRVLPDLAVAWLTGQMTAGVYFTLARRRATAAAGQRVHDLVAGAVLGVHAEGVGGVGE
jgi:hypothetical protein